MTWRAADHLHMSHALKLARRGLTTTHPNPCVGCVLVRDNAVVGEGWHQQPGGPHAEIMALEKAGKQAEQADCYVTLEPCGHTGKTPPCTNALLAASINTVFIAAPDPNPLVSGNGVRQLEEGGIRTFIGLMRPEAQALNAGFEMRMRQGRPYVRSKLALSIDGRTAMADGESQWITGTAARRDVQRWRARSAAIMTGINTVLADDPALTVREIDTKGRQPLRVILDRQLRLPVSAKLLNEVGETIIFTLNKDKKSHEPLLAQGAEIIVLKTIDSSDFLRQTLHYLAREKEINEVLLESGPVLSGAMLAAGLVDEILLYVAPALLGNAARPLYDLPAIRSMQDKIHLEFNDVRMIGTDIRLTMKPQLVSE